MPRNNVTGLAPTAVLCHPHRYKGAGFPSQLDLPRSGVSPESFSGAEVRLSTGSTSGWCHPALYSHSQALWPLLSHRDIHLLKDSKPPQQQRMVFGLATWLSKQQSLVPR